jgi:hypothetical protein
MRIYNHLKQIVIIQHHLLIMINLSGMHAHPFITIIFCDITQRHVLLYRITLRVLWTKKYSYYKSSICQYVLVPKKDKEIRLLKNWHLISLLNADSKITAKVLANRMQKVIPYIINHDQSGCIKSRSTFNNIVQSLTS